MAPWQLPSPDGQFLLVMIPEGERYNQWERVKALRATYPRSGVYRNDASHELLWLIDGYYDKASVFFASDGQQVVISSCQASGDDCLVLFLASDRRPKYLALDQCVPFARLKALISRLFFERDKDSFDPDALTYTVWSYMGERFTFDVRTGTLRDVSSPWHRCAVGVLACLAAIGAVLAWWLIRRGRDAKQREALG
jgi:hypothetical protein